MRVVVLLVRTSSRELDLLPFAPSLQMPVDEFRSIVRVQTQKAEGQHPFDLIQGLLHSGLPLPQQRPRLRPGSLNVGDVERIAELSFARIPGMRDKVDFRETRRGHVPAVGLHRDVVLQQIAGLGAPVNPPPLLGLLGRQATVHLPRTDREQLFLDRGAYLEALADPLHPSWQQRFQPHRPGIPGRLPYAGQDGQEFVPIAQSPPPFPPSRSLPGWPAIQNANGVFSVVPRGEAKFVQHHLFRLTICLLMPPIDGPEILPFSLAPQVNPPQIVSGSGYILDGAIRSPPVTF